MTIRNIRLVHFKKTILLSSIICSSLVFTTLPATSKNSLRTLPPPIEFKNSCRPEVQKDFSEAAALLHSFEYPESSNYFNKVLKTDPNCAMAYWGIAMNIWHPLWGPPSKETLKKGEKILAKTDNLVKTPREAAYIQALKQFYSNSDVTTNNQRKKAYEKSMQKLYEENLDDIETTLFYALSLISTANPRDKSYQNQYKAASLLKWVQDTNPNHPGALHYLIHAYDYPGLAHLALNEARTYAGKALNSAHAQHMPSHIFTRLGDWEASLSSNHDSTKSAQDYTENAKLPGYYDQGIHSMDYLMYAMLQTGRDEEAARLFKRLFYIKTAHHQKLGVAFTYAALPSRYVLERKKWDDASKLKLSHPNFPWHKFKWAPSVLHFARGLGAARSGKISQAHEEIIALKNILTSLPKNTIPYMLDQVKVQRDIVTAWVLHAEGKTIKALELLKITADHEDATDKHPVSPGETLPARELYADLLSETNKHKQALKQYRIVMKTSPNRLNSLIGAAQSAAEIGDIKLARSYEKQIRKQTLKGNRKNILAYNK